MTIEKARRGSTSRLLGKTTTKYNDDTSISNNVRYTEKRSSNKKEIRPIENYNISNIDDKAPQEFDSFMQYLDKEIQENVSSFKKHSGRYQSYRKTWMLSVANFLIKCLIPKTPYSLPSGSGSTSAVGAVLILAIIIIAAALWLVAAIVLPIIAGIFALGHVITKSAVQKVSNDKAQQNLINIEIYRFLKKKLTDILPNQDSIDYKELHKVMESTLKNQDLRSKKQISSLSAKFDDVFESYTKITEITKKMEELDEYNYSGEEIEKMEKTIADIKRHHQSTKIPPLEIITEEYRKAINPEENYQKSTANKIQNLQKKISQYEAHIQKMLQSSLKEKSAHYKPIVRQLKEMKKNREFLFSELKDEDKQLIKSYQLRIENAKKRENYQQQREKMYKSHKSADMSFKDTFSDIFEILGEHIKNEKNKQIINDVKKSLFNNKTDNKDFISNIIQVFSSKLDEQVDNVNIDKYKMYDKYASAIASDLQIVSQIDSLPHKEE